MSHDYALFLIQLSNDFEWNTATHSVTTNSSRDEPATTPTDAESARVTNEVTSTSVTEATNEGESVTPTTSLCVALSNYLAKKTDIEPMWMVSENKKTYQITFYIEFGLASDRMLQDLLKLGIGRRSDTKVFVLPTIVILEGRQKGKTNEQATPALIANHQDQFLLNDIIPTTADLNSDQLTLAHKIRKRINESNFKKSVRARLMVHQVVASIRASTALSFDFVLMICLASMLAAFGLLENSTVVIVASMLVSPMMNPILGIVFGLSIREHSLWRRGLRNELIGLLICLVCGFLLGLVTTFAETKWGSSTSFPTAEMRSRGDIKRLWVGVLIALPSGAGVALSVLGGNTGSLVGVAISASLLPPAVNSGLLFAYAVLGTSVASIASIHSSSFNVTYAAAKTLIVTCPKYTDNDYIPLYQCDLATEAAILAACSLLLTIVNILCIVIMALFILRIKEVVPLHQPNKDISNFFHHDVKVARDYNKTVSQGELDPINATAATLRRNQVAQSIINQWKRLTFAPPNNRETSVDAVQSRTVPSDPNRSSSHDTSILNVDFESRRKLFRLMTFAKEYDLDLLATPDYELSTWQSQEKVRLLVSDLLDMSDEFSTVFVDLSRLQPGASQTSSDVECRSFYQELIESLPTKWYQLFTQEQQRRQTVGWSSTFSRSYSLRTSRFAAANESFDRCHEHSHTRPTKKLNPKAKEAITRQNSLPIPRSVASKNDDRVGVPVAGTRFRIAKPPSTTRIVENETETF